VADGHDVVVHDEGGRFEPMTGQQFLNFEVSELRDDVVRLLRREPNRTEKTSAYELYLEGCRLDEDETTFDGAEEAYRKAAELDPSLSSALTNLGNLRFRRGFVDEAEVFYRRALDVDDSQPEAYYNLGFLHFERGEPELAVEFLVKALESDPAFADAHFNLAMAYEELGDFDEARPHWEAYMQLDPDSPWAEIAARHLR
jgi:tetratricopeptide (TPR) repeat protein